MTEKTKEKKEKEDKKGEEKTKSTRKREKKTYDWKKKAKNEREKLQEKKGWGAVVSMCTTMSDNKAQSCWRSQRQCSLQNI